MSASLRSLALACTLLSPSCASVSADVFEKAYKANKYQEEEERLQEDRKYASSDEILTIATRLADINCEKHIAKVNPLVREGALPQALETRTEEGELTADVVFGLTECKGSEAHRAEARRIYEAAFEASLTGMRSAIEEAIKSGELSREKRLMSLMEETFPPSAIPKLGLRMRPLFERMDAGLDAVLVKSWRDVDALAAQGEYRKAATKADELAKMQPSSPAAQERLAALRRRAAAAYVQRAAKACANVGKLPLLGVGAAFGLDYPERGELHRKLATAPAFAAHFTVIADGPCADLVSPRPPAPEGALIDVRLELRACRFDETTREEDVEHRYTVSVPTTVTRYRTEQKTVCNDELVSHCPGNATKLDCYTHTEKVCRAVAQQVPYTERIVQEEVRTEQRKERLRMLSGRVDGAITASAGALQTASKVQFDTTLDERAHLGKEQREKFSRMTLADVRKDAMAQIEQNISFALAEIQRQVHVKTLADARAAEQAGEAETAETHYVIYALRTRSLPPQAAAFLSKRHGLDAAELEAALPAQQEENASPRRR